MSEVRIKRRTRTFELTLGNETQTAATLRLDDMAGGVVSVGTMASGATTLQLYAAMEESGPYRRVYGSDGSAADVTLVPSTSEGQVYSLPDAIYAMPFVRIVTAGTAATAVAAVVSLKS